MRNLAALVLLVFAVCFGSTHASAFAHHHDDTASMSHAGHHSHAGDFDDDPIPTDSDDGNTAQLSHSHCAMAPLASVNAIYAPVELRGIATRPQVPIALSSLGIRPALEPPSA